MKLITLHGSFDCMCVEGVCVCVSVFDEATLSRNLANSRNIYSFLYGLMFVFCSLGFKGIRYLIVMLVQIMDLLMVMHWRCLVNDSIEAVVLVGGVVHSANGTIWLHQRVLALHGVTVASLML